jgi:thiol-disulfide isomerase/thioredoxin
MSRLVRAVPVVVAATAILLAGCSAAPPPGPSNPAGTAAEVATGPGDPAPSGVLDFAGTTLGGAELDVATLTGSPVVLWFWAPWCTICRVEGPDVAEVAAEFDGRVTVLGVPGRGPVDAMQDFVADTGTRGLVHVVDPDGAIWNRFGVVSQPAFVFVDRSGAARIFSGSLGPDALRTALDELA